MFNLSSLKPKIARKDRKRVGRGTGSGHGAFSGRGIKGQKARTGGGIRPGFEGGRMPFIRQIPKMRGFRSPHPKAQTVALEKVVKVFSDGQEVNPAALVKHGLVNNTSVPIKLLGKASTSRKLTFRHVKLSAVSRAAVEKAGGQIIQEEIK